MPTEPEQHPVLAYPVGAGGVVTRALDCGAGSNTVVCLHGAGSRADRWRRNLPGLAARGYHVYALDHPGHGFAEKDPSYEHGVPRYAEVVRDFVDGLQTEGVVLLGTSIGGHIAAWVACQIPEKIKSVVLIGAVGIVAPDATSSVDSGRVSNTSPTAVRDKLEFLVFDKQLVTDAWVEEESRMKFIARSPGILGQTPQVSGGGTFLRHRGRPLRRPGLADHVGLGRSGSLGTSGGRSQDGGTAAQSSVCPDRAGRPCSLL